MDMAFRRSGRFRVTRRTCSRGASTSTRAINFLSPPPMSGQRVNFLLDPRQFRDLSYASKRNAIRPATLEWPERLGAQRYLGGEERAFPQLILGHCPRWTTRLPGHTGWARPQLGLDHGGTRTLERRKQERRTTGGGRRRLRRSLAPPAPTPPFGAAALGGQGRRNRRCHPAWRDAWAGWAWRAPDPHG